MTDDWAMQEWIINTWTIETSTSNLPSLSLTAQPGGQPSTWSKLSKAIGICLVCGADVELLLCDVCIGAIRKVSDTLLEDMAEDIREALE